MSGAMIIKLLLNTITAAYSISFDGCHDGSHSLNPVNSCACDESVCSDGAG